MQPMLYKFKSQAASDLILPGPQGDALLRLLGREPLPQGIFEVGDLAVLLQRLEAGLAALPEPPAELDDIGAQDDADDAEAPWDCDSVSGPWSK
jgi:hypothetical protein